MDVHMVLEMEPIALNRLGTCYSTEPNSHPPQPFDLFQFIYLVRL